MSHSFIRREIAALEEIGVAVERFSIRDCAHEVVDEHDREEAARTQVLLDNGVRGLLAPTLRALFKTPLGFMRSLRAAVQLGWKSDRGVLRHLIYLSEACALKGRLAESGCDHVHAHFGTNSTAVAMLCRTLGGPSYSFTAHGPEEFDKPLQIGLAEKIHHASFVAGVSSFGRSQLYRWCAWNEWPKIKVIHCGVDNSYLTRAPTPVPEACTLVCVGRLCEQKGQGILIEATAQLAAQNHNLELVLVGDGPMRGGLEEMIARRGLADRVRITGWMTGKEVQQELLRARALVLPSFAEGLPVVIMEALAMGRPVISTYIAGIPELVEDGVNGWLIPAGDIEQLATAMRTVIDATPEKLGRMGREGALRVAERHDAHKEAQKLAMCFTCALGADKETDHVSGDVGHEPGAPAPVSQAGKSLGSMN